MVTREDVAETAGRFMAIYTGAITDSLDGHGYFNQTLPSYIAPLKPGMKLAGPAFTVEGRPRTGHDYEPAIRKILAMLGSVPPGYVAVYQTNQSAGGAHLGELSVTAMRARGCAGTVIDGGCRDIEYILAEEYPVFARYTTPQDCVRRWDLSATNVPVTVGGVRVAPGDWVVADRDGIVIVPREVYEVVLADAEVKVSTENKIRQAVRERTPPIEAYNQYGSF